MKITYKLLFDVIILLGITFPLQAQETNDHLKPASSMFDLYDYQIEYYYKVRKVLFTDLSASPEIRFQVMPSFTPENVLDIEYDAQTSTYYLVYHICDEMIWYHKDWENIKVHKFKVELDKASVDLVKSVFSTAIAQTKYEKSRILGLDGTTYYFSSYDFGLQTGTTWSPSKTSNMGKLVAIGKQLITLARSQTATVTIDGDLKQQLTDLLRALGE